MPAATSSRLLPIGEFAAATQLSPKALRLYDEQRLLSPASVDAISGYRYYRREQIATGRLIRTLRDMDLSLAQIARLVSAGTPTAQQQLIEYAREADRRYAAQRRAFQAALASLSSPAPSHAPSIAQRHRPAMTVCVWPFVADRHHFAEAFHAAAVAASERMRDLGLATTDEPRCSLVDPLSEDEGRLEVLVPTITPAGLPQGATLRQWPSAECAALVSQTRSSHASDLTAALDAMFDWFDRHGYRASEPPSVAIGSDPTGLRTDILWAYEAPVSSQGEIRS